MLKSYRVELWVGASVYGVGASVYGVWASVYGSLVILLSAPVPWIGVLGLGDWGLGLDNIYVSFLSFVLYS